MIVAFAGQKGGSGKTSTALAVASEWQRRGREVLVVDTDPQGSARTWGSVAGEHGVKAPTVIAMGAGLHQEGQLPKLARNFDVVVVDCPPRHDELQRSVFVVADMVVLPCGPSAVDVWALTESIDLVKKAQSLRPELLGFVLITRKAPRTVIGEGARTALGECGLPVFKTELGYRITYQEAPAAGMGPTTYDAKGAAAKEVRALVAEIERELKRG